MSPTSQTRRDVLVTAAAVSAFNLISDETLQAAEGNDEIRQFRINVPEHELLELRRRIAATLWPDKETVSDESQGVPVATMHTPTGSWGFEQFTDGKPDGEALHMTCFSCHEPGKDRDFVFTRYSR